MIGLHQPLLNYADPAQAPDKKILVWRAETIVSLLEQFLALPPNQKRVFLVRAGIVLTQEILANGDSITGGPFFELPLEEQERRIKLKTRSFVHQWLYGGDFFETE